MGFVDNLKEQTGRMLLKDEMKSFKRSNAVLKGYADATSIGIIYDATEKSNYDVVKNYVRRVRNDQKEVKSLGFIDSKKLPGDQFIKLGMDFFTLAHLNWYYKPISKVTSNFMKEPFDILICLITEENLPIEYIAARSAASFRIGKFSTQNKRFLDFMIHQKTGEGVAQLIEQIDFYIHELNKK